MSAALLQLRLELSFLIVSFFETGDENEVTGAIFAIMGDLEVAFVLFIDVSFSMLHVRIDEGSVLVNVVIGSVGRGHSGTA